MRWICASLLLRCPTQSRSHRRARESRQDGRRSANALSTPTESSSGVGSEVLRNVSTAMVQVYKEQFGRGPTKVRTNYAGRDAVVCLLEHTMTPAERNLQAMGEHQRLRDIRLLFSTPKNPGSSRRLSGSPVATSRRSSAASTPTPTSPSRCLCCTPTRKRPNKTSPETCSVADLAGHQSEQNHL